MSMPTLCIIGAGRAGGSLARQWHAKGGFAVKCIYSRSDSSKLPREIEALAVQSLAQLPHSDALLISTSDASIAPVAQSLAELPSAIWQDRLVFHLSGTLPSSCLSPLADKGALIASAHPVRAFSNDRTSLSNTWIGVEGNPLAIAKLEAAFSAIGGHCFTLDSQKKDKYHAAAVIASNHLIALADASQSLWTDAGVDKQTGRALFESLVSGVLENLREQTPADALTGPIARADTSTIRQHLQSLDRDQATIATLYRSLSLYLLKLTDNGKNEDTQQHMRDLLKSKQVKTKQD